MKSPPVNSYEISSMIIPKGDVSSSLALLNKREDNPTRNTPVKITPKDIS